MAGFTVVLVPLRETVPLTGGETARRVDAAGEIQTGFISFTRYQGEMPRTDHEIEWDEIITTPFVISGKSSPIWWVWLSYTSTPERPVTPVKFALHTNMASFTLE